MAISSRSAFVLLIGLFAFNALDAQTGTALVRRAPTLNGAIEGSVHQMTAENTTFNSGASISGDLFVPGTPTMQPNGSPIFGGTLDGTGVATPSTHKVTLNSGARLGHLVRRTDPITLPTVAAPPSPTGTRSVSLNNSSQSPGDFATLRNLTLNSNVGPVIVPPGAYGNFNANSGSGFTLGVAGATTPAVYHFQNLTLNSNSTFTVVGPVIVTLNGGFSTNTDMGAPARLEWLKLRIAGGGLSLASNRTVYAHLEAPAGTLTLNGGSRFIGAVTADRLIVNSNAVLRLVAPVAANQPPVVALTAPADAASFTAPAGFMLSAAASDPDGSIAKVEFYQGVLKLGEDTAAPYEFGVAGLAAGTYVFSARASDAQNLSATSAVVTVTVGNGAPLLPFVAGFEAVEGYTLGPVDGQKGWAATSPSVVTDADFTSGVRSVLLPGSVPAQSLTHDFPAHPANPVVFVDFFTLPMAGADESGSARIATLNGAQVALVRAGTGGRFHVYHGNGAGGGLWQPSRAVVPVDAEGYAADWVRVTLRVDYGAHRWDLYVGGVMAAADAGFANDAQLTLGSFTLTGHANAPTLLDDFLAAFENPLFADADRDGMDDTWETARGLNATINDRNGDLDADGLTNVREYLLGTQPNAADTDADGLSDAAEGPLGTNPTLSDSDGDGLADGWESTYGLNPLSAADAALDPDGDGLTNLQEFQQGKDPADYFNGQLPTFTSLLAADGALGPGDTLSVLVTNTANQPLANAPVKFTSEVGGHLLAETTNGAASATVTVRTGPDGIAKVYVKRGVN